MLTFLLDSYKSKVLKAYRMRLATLYLSLLSLVFLTGFALAIPQYAILNSKREVLQNTHAINTKNVEVDEIKSEVNSIKSKLSIIKENGSQAPIISILEKVLSKRGSGISITALDLSRGGGPASIRIEGTADTRDALVAFSKRLQEEPSFSNAVLPVKDLAKNKDIRFSITVDSKF